MTTPRRGLLFHITHIDNLASVIANGLHSDSSVRADRTDFVEIGEDRIKSQRRQRPVPIPPGGVVADYVPFYFAARSPMLYTISRGNVDAYQDGQEPIVYLVTEVVALQAAHCQFVFTDRNAYYQTAVYESDPGKLSELVDWPLMEAVMWRNTPTEPDRVERRMAEFLVHGSVPFSAFTGIVTRSETMAAEVRALLATIINPPAVAVRPNWYYEGR